METVLYKAEPQYLRRTIIIGSLGLLLILTSYYVDFTILGASFDAWAYTIFDVIMICLSVAGMIPRNVNFYLYACLGAVFAVKLVMDASELFQL